MNNNNNNHKRRGGDHAMTRMTDDENMLLPHISDFSVQELLDLSILWERANDSRLSLEGVTHAMGLVLIHGSWNDSLSSSNQHTIRQVLSDWLEPATRGLKGALFTATMQVCEHSHPQEYNLFIQGGGLRARIPPSELPALALVSCARHIDSDVEMAGATTPTKLRYLRQISAPTLLQQMKPTQSERNHEVIYKAIRTAVYDQEDGLSFPITSHAAEDQALRIFVAGDKSSVGKSSICLGLLGSLIDIGYPPSSLAYIKPATQSESTQLIQVYCQEMGIKCVPIGPLVYYRGFTRAFLAGQIPESTEELLATCGAAVDRVARNKQVVLIDGVGFPAVGSICGTSNASVAKACGYPTNTTTAPKQARKPMGVLLVGGSGVGGAVDAYNLNATYFQHNQVPVLGAIFNKLSLDGFYSLENCREQVTRYFDQYQPAHVQAFGFVPQYPAIAGDPQKAMGYVHEFIQLFQSRVNVMGVCEAAKRVQLSSSTATMTFPTTSADDNPHKRLKSGNSLPKKSRQEIEQGAILAGAAPSA